MAKLDCFFSQALKEVVVGVLIERAMRMSGKSLIVCIAALAASAAIHVATPTAAAPNTLTPDEAPGHIGKVATVCGVVVSTRYAPGTKGQPTFLNFDLPYPRQVFTVLIWGSDRAKFGTPETALMGKEVCAKGTIQSYKGKAEIIATDPRQLVVR